MIEAIVAAALHAVVWSLVLGAALFAFVTLIVRFVALDAAARHALWSIALAATAIMPLTALGVSATRAVHAAGVRPSAAVRDRASEPRTTVLPPRAAAAQPTAASVPATHFRLPALDLRPGATAARVAAGIWLAGAVGGLAGLALSVRRVRALKRRSRPLEGGLADELPWLTDGRAGNREIYLRLSDEIETPVAIGFRMPVILIPTDLALAGGLAGIETLVMHENAHLRRYDDWTNLGQRLIERTFWFNPLVWILGRRIALEREIASDDAVVRRTGNAQAYATSLWRLAREMRMPEHATAAPGALLTRKQISLRIESLLAAQPSVPALTPIVAVVVGSLAIAAVATVASSAPALELPALELPALAAPLAQDLPRMGPPLAVDQRRSAVSPAVVGVVVKVPEPAALRLPMPGDAQAALRVLPRTIARALQSAGPAADRTDPAPPAASVSTAGGRDAAAELRACNGCDLSGRDFRGADLRGVELVGGNLAGADLRGARLDGARFTAVDLRRVNFGGASLTGAVFTGSSLDDAAFTGARLAGLRIIGSSLARLNLRDLDLRTVLGACEGCDLHDAGLRNADLHGVRLAGTNLAGADLRGADLHGSRITGCNLHGADLRDADLSDVRFTGSALDGADLRGARTAGASFVGTSGAPAGARFDESALPARLSARCTLRTRRG